jgi:hypothetical protein
VRRRRGGGGGGLQGGGGGGSRKRPLAGGLAEMVWRVTRRAAAERRAYEAVLERGAVDRELQADRVGEAVDPRAMRGQEWRLLKCRGRLVIRAEVKSRTVRAWRGREGDDRVTARTYLKRTELEAIGLFLLDDVRDGDVLSAYDGELVDMDRLALHRLDGSGGSHLLRIPLSVPGRGGTHFDGSQHTSRRALLVPAILLLERATS